MFRSSLLSSLLFNLALGSTADSAALPSKCVMFAGVEPWHSRVATEEGKPAAFTRQRSSKKSIFARRNMRCVAGYYQICCSKINGVKGIDQILVPKTSKCSFSDVEMNKLVRCQLYRYWPVCQSLSSSLWNIKVEVLKNLA